jgi:hypothetical protein
LAKHAQNHEATGFGAVFFLVCPVLYVGMDNSGIATMFTISRQAIHHQQLIMMPANWVNVLFGVYNLVSAYTRCACHA